METTKQRFDDAMKQGDFKTAQRIMENEWTKIKALIWQEGIHGT